MAKILIEQAIAQHYAALIPVKENQTQQSLSALAVQSHWSAPALTSLDQLAKLFDIQQKLSQAIPEDWLALFALLLAKSLFLYSSQQHAQRLKRLNVLYKVLDHTPVSALQTIPFDADWPEKIEPINQQTTISFQPSAIQQEKIIPLTVLFYEGPIARAYLQTMKLLKLKPKKIIQLIAAKDIVSKKPLAKRLPTYLRKIYANNVQRQKIHYWPQRLKKQHPHWINAIQDTVSTAWAFPKSALQQANQLAPLTDYSPHIDSLLIDNLRDPRLQDYLQQEDAGALLFTGGGIMPKSLFSIAPLKFIHIHPGFLPDFRGADCTLWSTLLTEQTSASCFYMDPGIDSGDIILASYLPKLALPHSGHPHETLMHYRAIYSFVDPWVRAFMLRALLQQENDFSHLTANQQNHKEGLTFHFMHEKLRVLALASIYPTGDNAIS